MHHQIELTKHKVLILVGGLGTRLLSMYAEGPKAMAPIHGAPFLAYLLAKLSDEGFEEVVLCVGHKHQTIQDHFGDGSSSGLRIEYSVEEELLGTGGAIRLAAQRFAPGQRVFAMNGDTLHALDYSAMLQFHGEHRAKCTIGLAEVGDASRYGSVELDEAGRVSAFREKSAVAHPGLVNSGTYILEPDVVEAIPAGRPVSLEREVLPTLLDDKLMGFPASGYFIDIGVPEDYLRAQKELGKLEVQ
jgi:mannose-1-phosphate guanylyltransferase